MQLPPKTPLSLEVGATGSRGAYDEGYSYSDVFMHTNSVRMGLDFETPLGLLSLDLYRNEEGYSDLLQ